MALTKASLIDLNSNELILDLDADTSITADTDDTIHFKIAGSDEITMTAGAIAPSTSDGNALGTTSLMFSDLFLASGSVVNFNNGDVTITHSSNTVTLAGGTLTLPDSGLVLNSTAVTSTAAELNLIDGGTSTGTTAVADADGIITNDGGTMRLTTAATFKTYFQEGISQAYDDFTIGDAAVLITTSSGNITIDAAANDSDIIFKGTDGGADKVFATFDGSAGGDLFLNGGLIDLKNDGSNVSQIKFYCESSNAHAQTLIGAPHAQSADNTLTLPDGADGVLLSTTSTATLTNKTLTSPVINTGTFGTSILPTSADGTTLGSASKEFSDLFLADSSTIQFGNDQDTTLTHTDGSGLTLNSTNKLMFNDASQFIQGASATVLDIAATDEIELTATLIDVVGNLAVSGTLAQADAITMATNKKIIFRDAAIHISSTADGDMSIAADDEIDITSTLIDINGNVEISGTTTLGGNLIVGSATVTEAQLEILDGATVTTTELNLLDGGTSVGSSITLADADGFVVNDGGAMKTIPASDIKTYNPGGTAWQSVVTGATTMVSGRGYFVNTTSSAFAMTLPSSASIGDYVQIIDYAGTADTNNITISRNSHKIQGEAADLVVTTERAAFTLVYVDSTQGWLLDSK